MHDKDMSECTLLMIKKAYIQCTRYLLTPNRSVADIMTIKAI